jgi:hypothetical protein
MEVANLLAFLRSTMGSTSYRRLPVPTQWDAVSRPHVALLDSAGDRAFCFFLSHPSPEDRGLSVAGLRSAEMGTIVEVRHSALDYRYYRRDSEVWRPVAEVRSVPHGGI